MGKRFSKEVFIAKEDYTPLTALPDPAARTDQGSDDPTSLQLLKFKKGDLLIQKSIKGKDEDDNVIEMNFDNKLSERFFYMMNKRTKEKGYVYNQYIAEKGSLECNDWFFGKIGRGRAECFLQQECNIKGTWLIRESENRESCYVLSIKDFNLKEDKGKFEFQHYIIYCKHDRFYLTERQQFLSLEELAQACRNNNLIGLKHHLTHICQRPRPTAFNEIGRATGKWIFSRDDVFYDEKTGYLGGGNFGEVFKGTFRGSLTVAIKTLKADMESENIKSRRARDEFHQESKILMKLHHPNLVQVFGIVTETAPFLMILEYCSNGCLKTYLRENGQRVTFDQLISMCENIASGMMALENQGIIHRDLAARNIMLDDILTAKVGDFGLARENDYDGSSRIFPYKWTALEAIQFRTFNHKTDVWSFGIVLWEIFSLGASPYPHLEPSDILDELERGYRLPLPTNKGKKFPTSKLEGVYNIMLSCWQENPDVRPTFETLRNDFTDFDSAIEQRYNYSYVDFMSDQNMTYHPPISVRRPGRPPPGSKPKPPTKPRVIPRKKSNPTNPSRR